MTTEAKWPKRLSDPIDPLVTWRAYQEQSRNTRDGVVPDIVLPGQRPKLQSTKIINIRRSKQ